MSDVNAFEAKKIELNEQGFCLCRLPLSSAMINSIRREDWPVLDNEVFKYLSAEGPWRKLLSRFTTIKSTEHIIAIRDAANEFEEDGIWHDDGSRVLAFSLSLTFNSRNIIGGLLGFRIKGSQHFEQIPTPLIGTAIIFKTGVSGYEHKIHQLTQGRRIIIAGWLS